MVIMSSDVITIVSGLPRSGTSMMMRMIEAGGTPSLVDNIRVADEDNPRGYYEFEPVKKTKEDASWLERAGGKVVKMVHLLLLDLPLDREYRVVFMRRAMDEVIRSQNVMLERHGKGGGSLEDDRVKQIFAAQLKQVQDYLQSHLNFHVLEITYNEVLAEPAPAVAAINEFLGGEMNTAAMLEVVEPSLYRQRQDPS